MATPTPQSNRFSPETAHLYSSLYRSISWRCSSVVIGTSLVCIALWLSILQLREVVANLQKFNTSLLFLCSGFSLQLLLSDKAIHKRRGFYLAIFSLAFSMAILSQYVFGWNLGIDEFIIKDPSREELLFPGRVSPITLFSHTLCSFLLICSYLLKRRPSAIHFAGSVVVAAVSGLALIGYLFDVSSLYQIGPYLRISWVSALLFLLLTMGIQFGRANLSPLRHLTSPGFGGLMARRLLGVALFLPLVLSWLLLRGLENRYFEVEAGLSLLVLLLTVSMVFLIWWCAKHLNSLDEQRVMLSIRENRLLAEREHYFRSLIDNSPALIWTTNAIGECTYISAFWKAITGREPEGELGFNWKFAIHPEDRERVAAEFLAASGERQDFHCDYRLVQTDQTYRWVGVSGLPRFDSRQVFLGFIGTIYDIDERKHAEERMAAALRYRDEFISIASHELKTPITTIKLLLQMTQQGIKPISETMDMFLFQLDRLTHLIEDLMDVSRIRAGKMTFSFQKISATELVRETAANFQSSLQAAGCQLILDVPPRLSAHWDGPRIEQVLVNLLSNSTKYAKGKPITISMKEVGDNIEIIYRDHGPGIPTDKKETIFEAFERLEYTSKTTNGLGLGLFIVKQIVSGHRGKVELQQESTDGASFLIRLPRDARSVYLSAAQSTWGTPALSASIKTPARNRLSLHVTEPAE